MSSNFFAFSVNKLIHNLSYVHAVLIIMLVLIVRLMFIIMVMLVPSPPPVPPAQGIHSLTAKAYEAHAHK